ncbi:MAG: hypothetical protein IPN17_18480 [Deltaproteobacteria bacterium]|nr:hypothetical protein [Deltaproteobacteria bacterium]
MPPSGVDPTAPPTHFFNIIANSSEFGRPDAVLTGTYQLPYTVVDRSGAGYRVEVGYSIACDEADRRAAPTRCGAVAPR